MNELLAWYRWPDIRRKVGVSRPTIKRWEDAGIFPKARKLGPKTRPGAVAWAVDEVEAWVTAKARGEDWNPSSGGQGGAA